MTAATEVKEWIDLEELTLESLKAVGLKIEGLKRSDRRKICDLVNDIAEVEREVKNRKYRGDEGRALLEGKKSKLKGQARVIAELFKCKDPSFTLGTDEVYAAAEDLVQQLL